MFLIDTILSQLIRENNYQIIICFLQQVADGTHTVDERSDIYSNTTHRNSIGNELKLVQIEPRNMKDSDITPQKLGDSGSEITQTNSIGKELQIQVSNPTKVEDVEPVAGELKDNYNEMLQTNIGDKELYEDKTEQRKTVDINSATEELNVLYSKNKQVCVKKKLQMEESETWNMKGTDSSGEQTHLGYINETKHSCSNTDGFRVNRNETTIVENDLQIEDTNVNNNKANQSVDLSKCLSNDSINSNGSDGKTSESDSFVSDSLSLKTNKSYHSQLGLTEKLQPWIMSHMKASMNSPLMQLENSVIDTVRLTSEMEHKEMRIKTNNVEKMETDSIVESQQTGSVGDISIIHQKPVSEEVLQNVTDEGVDVLSSLIEDVPSKKGQNFFGKIFGFFGGNTKEHSHNTSLSENQKICDNEQNSPNLSLSEVCSIFYSNTSQNMNESFNNVSQYSSVIEAQCSEEATSAGSRSCADKRNDANTNRSGLHNDCLNNTHTKTVGSEDSTTLHNKLSEMVGFQQESEDISTKKLSSILNSSEKKCVSDNRDSVLQNQNIKTDVLQSHHEYVDTCSNQNKDCYAEVEESKILESEFAHQSCNKVSSFNDGDNVTNESVFKLVEDTCSEAEQTLLSSSGTKEEHMSKTDRLHNIFVETCETKDIDLKLLPQLVEKDSLRPQVLWHQDSNFVWIHILLHDVQKYKLLWSAREIYFK